MNWIDRADEWATRQRVPWWALILLLFFALALTFNAVMWIDGSLAPGTLGPLTIDAFYAPYSLAAVGILRAVADRAIQRFRPALDVTDAEFASVRSSFVNTRPRTLWLSLGGGAVFAALTVIPEGEFRATISSSALTLAVVIVVGLVPGYAAAVLMVVRAVMYLVGITRLHRRAVHVDLFNREPAHALSSLSAAAGGVIIGIGSFSAATDPQTFRNPALIALNVFALAVAVVAFVGPLGTMRRRLRSEKERLEFENTVLARETAARMQRAVADHDDRAVGPIRDSIAALRDEGEALRAASTWPWEPRTLRGFATSLLLPVLTWFVTAGAAKLLDL
jgi:hypothetical protein